MQLGNNLTSTPQTKAPALHNLYKLIPMANNRLVPDISNMHLVYKH